jgi:spore maturation protein B
MIIPILFLAIIITAVIKKVNVFSSFSRGAGDGIKFLYRLLPTLATIFIMCELFEASGLSDLLTMALTPALTKLGIPSECAKLILIKPFSGSGSLAYLNKIIESCGVDSYPARCACVLYGSSETVFYLSAIYFSSLKSKRTFLSIIIVLFANLIATIFACFICRFI